MSRISFIIVVFLLGFNSQAQDVDNIDLNRYITAEMENFSVPGLVIAIVTDSEIIYIDSFGNTSLNTNTPITTDTQFMIGSSTKTLTATLIANLVEEGQFTWDVPIVELMPDLDIDPRIEMRYLLANASGIPRFDIPLVLQDQTIPEMFSDIEHLELAGEPGRQFIYSNHGIALAGYAAVSDESDTGEEYQLAIQRRIFDPLNMENSTFDFDAVINNGNFAHPYRYNVESRENMPVSLADERFVEAVLPAGGAWSNINDMAQYAQMLLNDGQTTGGNQIISTDMLDFLWTPRIPVAQDLAYGIGWFTSDYHGYQQVEHAGNTAGFSATIRLLPEENLGLVILSNRALANPFINAIGDYAFETVLGLEHDGSDDNLTMQDNQLRAFASPLTIPADVDTLRNYLGDYERNIRLILNDNGRMVLETERGIFPVMQLENGQIVIQARTLIQVDFQENEEGITVTLHHPLAGDSLTIRRIGV